jgi:hypothetical protein
VADIFNEQRVVGVVFVPDGTTMYNGLPVRGVLSTADGVYFVDNQRVVKGVEITDGSVIYNDQPVIGVVDIQDGRKLYNNQLVTPLGIPTAPDWVLRAAGVAATIDANLADGVYWGAPLSNILSCSRASSGYAQTSSGLLVPFSSNVPRITDLGLLVEGGRTNLLVHNLTLNTSWSKQNITIGGTTTAPDGSSANLFVQNAGTLSYFIKGDQGSNLVTYTNGVTYTWSIYAKATPGHSVLYFEKPHNTPFPWTAAVKADLSAVTISQLSAGATGSISPLANGWYRITITATAAATQASSAGLGALYFDAYGASTGDGSTGFYLWGAMLEANAPHASSLIVTTSAAATRSADNMTGAAALLAAYGEVGTVRVHGRSSPSSFGGFFAFNNNAPTNRVDLRSNQGFLTNCFISAGGSDRYGSGLSAIAFNVDTKTAVAWAAGNARCVTNGTLGSVGTPTAVPAAGSITTAWIGNFDTGSFHLNNYIKRISVWRGTRIGDADLQSFTA